MNRREEILAKAKGTTYREINKSTFRSLEIIIPQTDVLATFNEFAYDTIKQTRLLKKQNQKLKQARDLFLPRLMNGEIEV
jgi:type I restriction enzyme S subunit